MSTAQDSGVYNFRTIIDAWGKPIPGIGHSNVNISGNASNTTVFTGNGILYSVVVLKPVTGGIISIMNTNGDEIYKNAKLDYAGSYTFRQLLTAGCKVTTTNFGGGELTVIYTSEA